MSSRPNDSVTVANPLAEPPEEGGDRLRLLHPFAWYKALSPVGRAAFFSCFAGVTLDAMDMRIYSFLMPSLAKAWGVTDSQLGVLFSAAMITAAIGGWVTGLLSDRFGRVRILQLTILIYSVFTFASGFASNFTELM